MKTEAMVRSRTSGEQQRWPKWCGNLALFVCILLGTAAGLRAQGVRYDNIALGPRGTPVGAATIAVCSAGASTTATPCSPLANIYSDESLAQPIANPFQADSLGNYGFWAAPGHYIVQIYGAGITTKSMDVFLPCDPSNCSMSSATFSTLTAGTINLTGALTVNGRNVSTEPKSGDAVMYVSPNGNDSSDGLSWGSAKLTLNAAVTAMESSPEGGTIYVAANSACGGSTSQLLLNNGTSPGGGWINLNGPLTIVGVGVTGWPNNSPGGQVSLSCGSSSVPAMELQGVNRPLVFKNLNFSGSMGVDLVQADTTITFDNDGFTVNSTVATNGPAVEIGPASFWIYFRHCTFQANTNSGKTVGSDAAEAMVINDTGTQTSNLIYIDESIANAGSVKFDSTSSDAASNALQVNGLTCESQTDGKGCVWIEYASRSMSFYLANVGVADATTNPTPAVEVDGADTPESVTAINVVGYGNNTSGEMTRINGYPNNNQNSTVIAPVKGQFGFVDGRFYGLDDAGRRLFAPTAAPYANQAYQLPTAWYHNSGGTTVNEVAAPDGTTDAGQLVGGSTGEAYNPNPGGAGTAEAVGDIIVGGVWVHMESSSTDSGYPGGAAWYFNNQACVNTWTALIPTGSQYLGQNYIQTTKSGEWEWWPMAIEATTAATGPCYPQMILNAGVNDTVDFYAPYWHYFSAGTITTSEAAELALWGASYPDSVSPPIESTLRGHPFAFGGSGDNYLAILDHTALTQNQTYTFPNASGTVALSFAGTTGSIGGSALAAGACTTGAASVTGATTSMAVAVSPSADPGAGFTWEAWVSAAGTITVRVCNVSGVSATPAAETYNVRAIQ